MSARVQFLVPAGSQVLASVQSLLVSVLVARSASVDEFGKFGLMFALWAFAVGFIRSGTSELFIFRTKVTERSRSAVAGPLAVAALLAMLASLLVLTAGIVLPGLRTQLIWLAVSLPFFALQDAVRVLLVSVGRPLVALVIDLGSVALIGGAALSGTFGTTSFAIQIVWASAAALAGVVGITCLRPTFRKCTIWDWWSTGKGESLKYFADFSLTNSLTPFAMVLISGITGPVGAAAVRVAQMFFAPIAIVSRGLLIASAGIVRRAADEREVGKVVRLSRIFGVALALVSIVLGALLMLLPVDSLASIAGSSAEVGRDVIPAAALTSAALSLAIGAGLGLRAFHRIGRVLVAKIGSFPIAVGAVTLGAIVLGAPGAQAGLAVGETVRSVWSWSYLLGAARRIPRDS